MNYVHSTLHDFLKRYYENGDEIMGCEGIRFQNKIESIIGNYRTDKVEDLIRFLEENARNKTEAAKFINELKEIMEDK